MRPRPRAVASLCLTAGILIPAATLLLPAAGSLAGRILEADRTPAAGARVRLFLDDVDAEPRQYRELKSLTTDDSGAFEFKGLPKAYYLVVADREGSARTFRSFVLDEDSHLSHDFVLRQPVRSALLVRDDAGRPLAGATLRSLDPRDGNGEFWFRRRRDWELFAALPAPSDQAGRIDLPELPEGAVFDATIDHPGLAPAQVTDVPVNAGVAAEAVLRPGVAVTLHVAPDENGERPSEADLRLLRDAIRHPSTFIDHRLPLDGEGTMRLTVEPGRYSLLSLSHEGFHFTPSYSSDQSKGDYFRFGDGTPPEFRFAAHRKVKVRGRVVDPSGRPVPGAHVQGELPNAGSDGHVPEGQDEWTHAGWGTTDANGEYAVSLVAGPARVSFHGEGRVAEQEYFEFDVAADGSTAAPEIRVRPMPKITGVVRDAEGRPVAGAIVRLRGLLRHTSPTTTDDTGRFELSPPWMPIDFETEELRPVQPLVAFHPYERLMARLDVHLDKPESLEEVTLTLAPHAPGALIDDFRDELSRFERGELSEEDWFGEQQAQSLLGQPALELEGTWLNMDEPAEGLAAFRGKYVLLDFWFIGCGPCRGDFPSVKLLHDLYKDRGLIVIAVHDNSATPETVREYAEKEGMNVPILVDEPDNRTNARYEGRRLSGYPSHILIGPDGTVIDDRTTAGPSLRVYKLELLRELLLSK